MRVIVFIIFFIILSFCILFSTEYYICLGSFIEYSNAQNYAALLNRYGIYTTFESVNVNNTNFTRVIYYKKYFDLESPRYEMKLLLRNPIFKVLKITNLWIKRDNNSAIKDTGVEQSTEDTKVALNNDQNSINKSLYKKNTENTDRASQKQSPSKYRVINNEGVGNIIFSNEKIEYGKEENNTYKTEFKKGEKIYARCYFAEPVGKVNAEDFWHEIWIDGELVMRTTYRKPPDPSWNQMQIFVSEDDYKTQLENLDSGTHTISIWVTKNEYKGDKAVAEVNAAGNIEGKIKEIWVPKGLAFGEFTYIVP